MKTLNLQKLFHAVIVSEQCSMVAASKKLHLTQSALTRSIKSLEDEIGVVIFIRKPSGVELTSEGEQFIRRAKNLLEDANELYNDTRASTSGERSVVSFGLDPIIADLSTYLLLDEFSEQSQLMQLQAHIESRSTLMMLLKAETIDFFIADINQFTPVEIKDIQIDVIQQLRGSFFTRAKHPLVNQQNVSLEDVYNYPVLTPSNVHEHAWANMRWNSLREAEWERKRQFICPDINALKHTVLKTNAVLAIADVNVAEEVMRYTLHRLDHRPEGQEDIRRIGVVTSKTRKLSIHSQRTLTELVRLIKKLLA